MNGDVVVVGGGAAGMEAAGQLAKSGCRVTLVEKEEKTGGHINNWYHLFPDRRNGEEVIDYLKDKVDAPNLTVLKGTRIDDIEKNRQGFIVKTDKGTEIKADAIVIATGFDLFRSERKEEYGYGIYDKCNNLC
jgi:heterodisulfide reductase subunit A2